MNLQWIRYLVSQKMPVSLPKSTSDFFLLKEKPSVKESLTTETTCQLINTLVHLTNDTKINFLYIIQMSHFI